jgi:alcohol-forming fatty acyl-CoA reductase
MHFKDFYAGKTLLLSGCTGFLGKMVLEKVLRSLSGVKRIYIMMRPRKNQSIKQRMVETIFTSEIFINLFRQYPGMEAMALEKCVPVSGDLIVEGLGIAPETR